MKITIKILSAFIIIASSAASHAQLEEIVVTAQKRSQNLQDVPISITALSEMTLENSGVKITEDLGLVVPGLNVTRQLSSFAPILRGVGNYNAAPGAEGAIATYIDGVYQPSAYGSILSLANIERVEVLKGPQGTLFGRNATGGLIHIITKDPSFEPAGKISVGYGSQDTTELKFYGSTGITESVAADLALFNRDQKDGFGKNIATGSDAIYRDEFTAKSKLLVDFSGKTQLIMGLDYSESESDLGTNRKPDEGTVTAFGNVPPDDFHDVDQWYDHISDSEQWGLTAKLTHQLDQFDLVGIFGYRDEETFLTTDSAHETVPYIFTTLPLESETYSAEIQIVSNQTGKLDWIVGAYYLDNRAGVYPFKITGVGVEDVTAGAPGGPFETIARDNEQSTESMSLFGEMSYFLTDTTKLTVGLRYTEDQRDYSSKQQITTSSGNTITPPLFKNDEKFSDPSWRIILDHRINEQVLVYGSYSRGFKSGIFSTFGAPNAAGPVDPEILDAFEIGFKGDFLDERLRINGSTYFYQYDDLQLTTQVQGVSLLRNAAEAEVYGVEMDVTAILTESFDMTFSASWLNSEFKSFPGAELSESNPTLGPCPGAPAGAPARPNCVTFGDAEGNDLPRAPELTVSIGTNYEIPIEMGIFGANATAYYNDGFYNDFANRFEQDSYVLVNASAYLKFGDRSQYQLRAFGRNIFDEEYYSFATAAEWGDLIAPSFGRSYGIEFEFSF